MRVDGLLLLARKDPPSDRAKSAPDPRSARAEASRADLDLGDLVLEGSRDGPVLRELVRELADERPELRDGLVGWEGG